MLTRGMRDACKYRTAYRKPIRRGMSRFPRFDVRVSSEASALRKEGGLAMPAHSWAVAAITNFPSTAPALIHLLLLRTRPYDDLMRARRRAA